MIDYRDLETRHNWYRKAGDGYAQNVCKLLEKKILTMLTLLKRLKMLALCTMYEEQTILFVFGVLGSSGVGKYGHGT